MKDNRTYEELLAQVDELEAKVRQLESKLQTNQQKSDHLKRRFLANISHELRTPMNAILGFSNLLIDKNLTIDKREEYMEHINANSNSLLNIVDSIIDASLLEAGELQIRKSQCNLHEVMQQVYFYFNIGKHKIGKDHIAILVNKEKHSDEFMIHTDGYRLSQILSNLLHNALKFTAKGIIEFGYTIHESQGKIEFFVKDSGKGVLFDKAQSIFDKFEKSEEGYSSREGGLGLGLTLAKGLTSLLGGNIWFESNMFNGTTFHFTIDYTEGKIMAEQDQPRISLHGLFV